MMKRDTGRTVLITGASAGLGRAIAANLLEKGYIVYGAARRIEKMCELKRAGARLLHMDVTDAQSVRGGVRSMIETEGRIDVLVNNAGYGSYGTIEAVPLEELRCQYDVNLFGMARVLQEVLPGMRERRSGRIVNMASLVGHVSTPVLGWYASTKHAVEGMSDALRMELKPFGIDVVIIEPGAVQTEFRDVALATLEKVHHPEDYQPLVDAFTRLARELYRKAPGPERTARIVVRAIEAKRPRPRYTTTPDAHVLTWVKRLLPARMLDAAILSRLR